jgi:hypothetical protein
VSVVITADDHAAANISVSGRKFRKRKSLEAVVPFIRTVGSNPTLSASNWLF